MTTRPLPHASPSVTAAATAIGAEPPTDEQIAGLQGAQVVLPPDSAAAAGARGVYPTIVENTALRNAGYEELGLDPADPSGEVTDPDVPPGGGNGGTATAPVNVDTPAVTQSADVLTCTNGNWQGEPTSYSYVWKLDNIQVGSDSPTYTALPTDVGMTATCTVTATNASGSTAAPPSVGVVVA